MSAPCHRNSTSARPIARARGLAASISVMVASLLRTARLWREDAADLPEFFRRGAPAGERLHDELRRRPSKRAIDQIRDEPPQRFLFGVTRTIDVQAALVLSNRQALLGHHLQRLERRGVPDGPE